MRSIALALSVFAACAVPRPAVRPATSAAHREQDPLALCAGRWIHRGPANILGREIDEVLEIARGPDGWTMRVDSVLLPGVRAERTDAVCARQVGEPSPLAVDGDRFVFRTALFSDGVFHEVRRTFRIDAGRLYFPAWVRRGACEWVFNDALEDIVIRTEHDPRVVASGSATSTGLPIWPTPITYTASVEPDPNRPGVEPFTLRFTQPDLDGITVELGRLVEDPEWGRALIRFNTHAEREWTPLTDAEWASIAALPRWASASGL